MLISRHVIIHVIATCVWVVLVLVFVLVSALEFRNRSWRSISALLLATIYTLSRNDCFCPAVARAGKEPCALVTLMKYCQRFEGPITAALPNSDCLPRKLYKLPPIVPSCLN